MNLLQTILGLIDFPIGEGDWKNDTPILRFINSVKGYSGPALYQRHAALITIVVTTVRVLSCLRHRRTPVRKCRTIYLVTTPRWSSLVLPSTWLWTSSWCDGWTTGLGSTGYGLFWRDERGYRGIAQQSHSSHFCHYSGVLLVRDFVGQRLL